MLSRFTRSNLQRSIPTIFQQECDRLVFNKALVSYRQRPNRQQPTLQQNLPKADFCIKQYLNVIIAPATMGPWHASRSIDISAVACG